MGVRRILIVFFILGLAAHAQPASKKQVDDWRRQMRQALFIPDPLPKLEVENYTTFEPTPGIIAARVSYKTAYGLRVPAIIYYPASAPAKKLPGMVLVNGHGADKTSWYAYYTAILYAKAGAVVVTYDPIGEGDSNDDHLDGVGEHDRKILDPPSMPARLGGLMITDIMQGVSYLIQRPDVDVKRIAVLGFSMGSFESALAGAADPRIHALLLTGGGDLDGTDGYWDKSAVMCQGGPYRALAFLGDRGPILYTLSARRGVTFILNGTNDTVVDIPNHRQDFFDALRQRTIALNGSGRGVFETYFDPGASHRPNWMTPTAATWLEKSLSFPNWSSTPVASLPVEPMRAWAERVGYTLNKSAAREDRDAGLPILVAPVPILSKEQLSILPLADWERRKSEFVYSTWVERATAVAKSATAAKP